MPLAPIRPGGGMYALAVQVATGTNETADHNLATVSLPANVVQTNAGASSFSGDAWRWTAIGTTDFAASATINFWLKVNGTKVQTASAALPASLATVKRFKVETFAAFRSTGVSASLMVQILGWHESLTAPSYFSANLIATPTLTTVSTAAVINMNFGMNWTAASASNNARCDWNTVEKVGGAGL